VNEPVVPELVEDEKIVEGAAVALAVVGLPPLPHEPELVLAPGATVVASSPPLKFLAVRTC